MPLPNFDPAAIAKLDERIEYELWLLELVYAIVDDSLVFKDQDVLIFPPSGGPPPTEFGPMCGRITFGDWRPGFVDAGAPLLFVTAFKVLDMLVEWVLEQNGTLPGWQFSKKLSTARQGTIAYPTAIESRPWLRERLIALYEHLEPLRSTIIHQRHFKTSAGSLQVSSSKGGVIGPSVSVSDAEIRKLSLLLVSVLHCIRGTWILDSFREKRLRRTLDELAPIHRLPVLGQLEPVLKNIRVYRLEADPIELDLQPLRSEALKRASQQDVVFRLRIVVVSNDGKTVEAFQYPFEELQGPTLTVWRADRGKFSAPLPGDVDPVDVAQQLQSRPHPAQAPHP